MRKQRKQENGVEIASRALPQPRDEAAQALALSHAPLLLELRHARQRRVALRRGARGRLPEAAGRTSHEVEGRGRGVRARRAGGGRRDLFGCEAGSPQLVQAGEQPLELPRGSHLPRVELLG